MPTAEPETDPWPALAYRDGVLELEGRPLDGLAAELGTPLFLVSERQLLASYEAVRRGLSSLGPAEVRYCAKANHEAGVLTVLAGAGAALLASHRAEVELALACGYPPERIAYQRPLAPPAELEAVLDLGVTLLHLTVPEDLERLVRAARRVGRRAAVCLRLALPGGVPLSPLGRLHRRLGLDAAAVVAMARELVGGPLRLTGVNVYVGTQRLAAGEFRRAVDRAFAVVARLRDECGVAVEELDLGGGLPSPTQRRVGPRDLWRRWRDRWPDRPTGSRERFARQLAELCAELAARHRQPLPRLVLEPGRAVVGAAAVLLARVEASAGRWLFLDTSRNVLGESPLLFARRLLPVRERPGARRRRVSLSGNTLNTTDVLDMYRRLPPLLAGDLLAFCDAGAYTISRASRYGSLAPAVHLLGTDGTVRCIRRAEAWGDLASAMELPAAAGRRCRTARGGAS